MKRKCYSCGKMATNPYVYHVVPQRDYTNMPPYVRGEEKPKRTELTGDRKVYVYNYCDVECYDSTPPVK